MFGKTMRTFPSEFYGLKDVFTGSSEPDSVHLTSAVSLMNFCKWPYIDI